jgi:hypothetical protein
VVSNLIKAKEAYSLRKNRTKGTAENSVIYLATSSDSASGRSKGVRFSSAKVLIRNTTNRGKRGIAYINLCCISSIVLRDKCLVRVTTARITVLKLSS